MRRRNGLTGDPLMTCRKVHHSISTICILLCFGPMASANADRPNVVLIFTDDQGSIDLNCYGRAAFASPASCPGRDRFHRGPCAIGSRSASTGCPRLPSTAMCPCRRAESTVRALCRSSIQPRVHRHTTSCTGRPRVENSGPCARTTGSWYMADPPLRIRAAGCRPPKPS